MKQQQNKTLLARASFILGSILISCAAQAAIFQAEDYSNASDTTPGNTGGAYRSGDVDIEATSDSGGGYNVGWVAVNEWLSFANLSIPASGNYILRARVASPGGGSLSMDLNSGSIPLAELTIPATGGWQTWTTVETVVHIDAGTYSLGVFAATDGWNLNWVEVTPATSSSQIFQAEDYTNASDNTPGNTGGAYRSDDVDIETTSDAGGGYNVGWWDAGEWLAFDGLVISESGYYRINARVASASGGGGLSFDLNSGSITLGAINIPNTGGWQNWQTVSLDVFIAAGNYSLGVFATSSGWNLNWIEVVPTDHNPPPPSNPVWNENFNNISAGSRWLNQQYTEVRNSCGVGGSRCVRVTYIPSDVGSPRTVAQVYFSPAKEYTLNYDVMFENGFEFVRGGKLPGLGPVEDTSGCDPISPTGWSARVMWRPEGTPVIYSYHQNRANRCGDDFYSNSRFAIGRYHAISLHVRVNDPGQTNGLIELYLDGQLIATHANVNLRGVGGTNTEINKLTFHTFFGGSDPSWAPSKTVYSRFDNFAVYPGLRVRNQPGQ